MFYWLILWSYTPICEYFVFLTIRIVISYLILHGNIILKLYFEFDFQVSCPVHNSLLRKIFEAGVQKSRSSRLKLFNKKDVLSDFAKFTGKHLRQSLFFKYFFRDLCRCFHVFLLFSLFKQLFGPFFHSRNKVKRILYEADTSLFRTLAE